MTSAWKQPDGQRQAATNDGQRQAASITAVADARWPAMRLAGARAPASAWRRRVGEADTNALDSLSTSARDAHEDQASLEVGSTKPIVRGPRRWAEAAGADRQILDGPARSAPQPRLQMRPSRKDYA